MLRTLYIENIAVIEKITIDFERGLNVLTGETGAGKSIIIDSINAVMGQRTSKEIIRTGADNAFVSAQFEDIGKNACEKLSELGFECEDDTVILQRTLSTSGKNNCKINGRPATVSMLREASRSLINIHGQHENYELFSPDTHIDYIDSYGDCLPQLERYAEKYKIYRELKKQCEKADKDEGERLREIDILTFQTDELVQADVRVGEEEALEAERNTLANFEKVFSLMSKARLLLSGDDNTDGSAESVDMALNAVARAARYNPEYEKIADRLSDIYYNLKDCAEIISDETENLEGDPQRLEEAEERLDLINRLKRKYGCSSDELPALANSLTKRLDELVNYDKNREKLIDEYKASERQALLEAEKLGKMRRAAAKEFAKRVKVEMSFLNMPGVELVPSFKTTELTAKGTDEVELLISANPGEAPKPVAKIASGGELSRMMLAIKTVLADNDSVDTLIFDEVDTGISGSAAEKVGLKLKEVSSATQVLCVTHQAQIAALCDTHFLIRKQIDKGRTFTEVLPLDHEGRRDELARIIGGVNITNAALEHAEAMLREYEH